MFVLLQRVVHRVLLLASISSGDEGDGLWMDVLFRLNYLRRLKEEEKERCEKGKQNITRIKTCYCYLRRRFVPLSSAHLRGRLRASRSRRATSEQLLSSIRQSRR